MGQYDWIEIRKNGVGDIYLILTSESSFLNDFVDFVDNGCDCCLGTGNQSGSICATHSLCCQVGNVENLIDLKTQKIFNELIPKNSKYIERLKFIAFITLLSVAGKSGLGQDFIDFSF